MVLRLRFDGFSLGLEFGFEVVMVKVRLSGFGSRYVNDDWFFSAVTVGEKDAGRKQIIINKKLKQDSTDPKSYISDIHLYLFNF